MLWSDPRNKNVEKWSSQLKIEVTDPEDHLHKITGQKITGRKGWHPIIKLCLSSEERLFSLIVDLNKTNFAAFTRLVRHQEKQN